MRRLGVRGYALLLCAGIWALIAYGTAQGAGRANPPGTFHDNLPLPLRVVLWAVPAAVAVALSMSTRHDWIALALLVVGPMLRCCSCLAAWILHLTGHPGWPGGWYSASYYVALIGIVALAAVSHRQPYLRGGDSGAGGHR